MRDRTAEEIDTRLRRSAREEKGAEYAMGEEGGRGGFWVGALDEGVVDSSSGVCPLELVLVLELALKCLFETKLSVQEDAHVNANINGDTVKPF